jgi:hypothetical protein
MIRQTRKYMVGALSGAGLIAAAVVAFVLLVSAQVFEDWPLAGLAGADEETSVSSAEPVAPGTGVAAAAVAPAGAKAASGPGGGGGASGGGAAGGGGSSPSGSQEVGTGQSPVNPGGGDGGGTAPGGNGGGPVPVAAPGGSSGGGGGTASNAGGGGGSAGGGGGETGGGSTTASTPSGKVTSTVNETVNQVDQTVTGGVLEETGVTQVTEGAVNGVAGPESTVGKVVDGTVGTVEGILKPKK